MGVRVQRLLEGDAETGDDVRRHHELAFCDETEHVTDSRHGAVTPREFVGEMVTIQGLRSRGSEVRILPGAPPKRLPAMP